MQGWIVVNADDLGVTEATTRGIITAHREGVVTSASLAVTTPAYGHAVATCVRTCPELGIGLHFTLTSGRPLTGAAMLVNDDGFFRWRFSSLWLAVAARRRADLIECLRVELDAQLDQLEADGIRPDHVDSERHVHLIPGILELVADAARRRGIPFVRAGVDIGPSVFPPAHRLALGVQGGLVKMALLSSLARRARRYLTGIRTPERVASYYGSGRMHLATHSLARGVPGGMEIMVHPGARQPDTPMAVGNGEHERYLRSEDRQRELQFCVDAGAWIDRSRLTTFRRLSEGIGA